MAVIANLDVNLRAFTGKFTENLKKATLSVDSFVAFALKRFAALAAFESGRRLFGAINEELDAIQKTSDRLGISVEHLSSLQFAAERSGIALSSMNMVLQRVQTRIGQTIAGSAEFAKSFEQLGLSVEDLSRMSLPQVMSQIVAALEQIDNQMLRQGLLVKIADTEGAAFLQMANQGSKAYEQLMDLADEATAHITSNATRTAAEWADAWQSMTVGFKSFATPVVMFFDQFILDSIQATKNLAIEWERFADAVDRAGVGIADDRELPPLPPDILGTLGTGLYMVQDLRAIHGLTPDIVADTKEWLVDLRQVGSALWEAKDQWTELTKLSPGGSLMDKFLGDWKDNYVLRIKTAGEAGGGRAGEPFAGSGLSPAALDARTQAGRSQSLANQAAQDRRRLLQVNQGIAAGVNNVDKGIGRLEEALEGLDKVRLAR